MRPGVSLLAQGEPMVWLTGGSLAICLLMISGLLLLVVIAGMSTFWPRSVVLFPLKNGTHFLGEVTRTEDYTLSKDTLGSLDQPLADAALAILDGKDRTRSHRQLVRTGNFELTNAHFHWVSDFELSRAGRQFPEWAVIAERVEWGRFYGTPVEFVLSHRRTVPAEEEQLLQIIQFFQSAVYQLPTDQQAEVAGQLAELQGPIEELRQQHLEIRQRNIKDFVDRIEKSRDSELHALLDTGAVIPVADLQADQNTEEIQEVWSGPRDAWAKYEEHHSDVRDRAAKLKHLEKHEIGRVNRKLEEMRLAVRQQELNQNVFVLTTANEIRSINLELKGLDRTGEENDVLIHAITRRLGAESPLTAVGKKLGRLLNAEIDRRKQSPEQRKRTLEKELADAPQPAQEAVESFLQSTEDADIEAARIQAEIDTLRQENEDYKVRFVTTHLEDVGEVTDDIAARLDEGQIPDSLRESASLAGFSIDDNQQVNGNSSVNRWEIGAPEAKAEQTFIVRREADKFGLLQPHVAELSLGEIVRAYPANQLSWGDKLSIYGSRWLEFLWDDPREANNEGGVFPAIWGTVAMTLIMSIVVVPFGVLAALYLREYAKAGVMVSAVRIAINNLAGVPSIVFGVFGLGFFCYVVGAYIDGGPENANISPWPPGQWFTLLLVNALVAVAAFVVTLLNVTKGQGGRQRNRWLGYLSTVMWLGATGLFVLLLVTTPYFRGTFEASLPNPTFGKGGLLWASLTLALLTLPVVIVATEEALSAVPNSLREGSYASGASKWQTIRRIVLPHALPGIMTGMILAMARGAGEVAPLMLVGAVKLAPELPFDGIFPFIHGDRSFMHLGFHIFDLGFQSQNSEAAKPMVFTTTLLLIAIIALLNISAIALRARLRKRFQASHF
jgi:ABC-type phosphate transport system permease subunit